MKFVIPGDVHEVNSKRNTVVLRLYDILPPNLDVQSMAFITDDPPDCLKSISIEIGGQRITHIPASECVKDVDLLLRFCGHGIKNSKCSYMHVNLEFEFEFDRQYLEEHEKYEMVMEMRDVVTYSEYQEEYYDGMDYAFGRKVYRNEEPTGRQVREVTGGVIVRIPDILCTLSEPEPEAEAYLSLPVWQTFVVDPKTDDSDFVRRLREKYKLELADDRYPDLDAAIASNGSFTGRIQNTIKYNSNMAGLCYSF